MFPKQPPVIELSGSKRKQVSFESNFACLENEEEKIYVVQTFTAPKVSFKIGCILGHPV